MSQQAFYDAKKSYEENYDNGPFGYFLNDPQVPLNSVIQKQFMGFEVDIPFGIPAGPLLNGKFIENAWKWGYSLATYKTVRGNTYPCHPVPNVIKVTIPEGEVKPGQELVGDLDISGLDVTRDGITNSFGVPSKPPEVWQSDVRATLSKMKKGNLLILSFMGTQQEHMTLDEYVADFVKAAQLAKETGAPILEVNFSCPNVGKEGLICNDVETSRKLLEAMKPARGNTPLLVKIGYFPKEQQSQLHALLDAIHTFADGVAAINTIQAKVVDSQGKQILPGSPVRLFSGVCGSAIKWAGLEMAQRIMSYKKEKNWDNFTVVGVGGVVRAEDYQKYMALGVDAVQSATGAMWESDLALQIREIEGI